VGDATAEGSSDPSPERPSEPTLPGLTNARGLGLSRVPIRVRESAVTLGGWRLLVASDQGDGSITLVDAGTPEPLHRGEGVFLGWPSDRLAAAYVMLAPPDEAALFDLPQLG
jgi:hypothetical protein